MSKATAMKSKDIRCGGRRTMMNLTKEQHEWAKMKAFKNNHSIASVIRAVIDEAMKSSKAD
jgi:hypothetical protein